MDLKANVSGLRMVSQQKHEQTSDSYTIVFFTRSLAIICLELKHYLTVSRKKKMKAI
jgi:hypothetical protein